MKLAVFTAIATLASTPLSAQSTPPAPSAGSPAVAATATAAAATRFNLDTPIETIAADPVAKKVLDADLQNITAHPMYETFKTMSLAQVQPLSQGALTDEALAKVKTDLTAIK